VTRVELEAPKTRRLSFGRLTVRRELVDNRKPEAAFYERQRLFRARIEDMANLRPPA